MTLSQVSVNIELRPEVFSAEVRDDYFYMTVEEFKFEGEKLKSNDLLVPSR